MKLKHETVDWDGVHDRIILYADIMGFKERLKNTQHIEIVSQLKKFIKELCKKLSPYNSHGHLRMTLFSDLIVIAADKCTVKNFSLIMKAASELMQLCHLNHYVMNGCISCGDLTFEEPEFITKKCKFQKK